MGSGGGATGAGSGTKAGNGKGKAKSSSKTNCMVCKHTTNKIPSNKDGSVQCGVCDGWWHAKCAQITTEKFEMIALWTQDGQDSPWKCQSCEKASSKLLKMVTCLSSKVGDNERNLAEQAVKIDRAEDKAKLQDSRMDGFGREIKEMRDQLAKLGDLGGPSIVREMDERALKETNLVFHRVVEAEMVETKARVEHDRQAIQQVLDEMEVDVGVERDTKFVRRLGQKTGDDLGEGTVGREPRPLLVGFLHRHHLELIQNNSWKLSESGDPGIRAVSVVKDLTMKQRLGEKDLLREAARKNCARSQEDLERNLAFKVVGRRGSKREILAPLRLGETINEEGEVIWDREDTGAIGGRRMARGVRRVRSMAATYPNSLPVGKPGGGTAWGQTQDTAQQRLVGQGLSAPQGRGGGRGRGAEATRGPTNTGRGGRGGDSDHHQEGMGREWQEVGKGGSTRKRDISRSPQGVSALPGKKVDSRASPEPAYTSVYPNLTELLGPKHSNDHVRGVEEEEEEVVEVVDDAEEVC